MSTSVKQSEVTRTVLRYHGGKWKLADWVIGFFPPHRIYVEPFGGGASVLMQKPRSYGEVYNDLDDEIVNLFAVLRDRSTSAELERRVRYTPYSRTEFKAAYGEPANAIDRAHKTLIRAAMGFGSGSATKAHQTGFRTSLTRTGTTAAQDWMSYPNHIGSFVERLRGVVIENRPALEVIPQHDRVDSLFYIDPPYPHETRYKGAKWRDCYRHEMTAEDHRALAEVLRSVKGMVVLSGYACDLYDRELYPDWHRVERKTFADGARERTEVLWLNRKASDGLIQQSLFGEKE
jgi:DNA adenine methylase